MRKSSLTVLFVAFGLCLGGHAFAEGASKAKDQECAHLLNQRSAATRARDWIKVEKLALGFIKECKGMLAPREYSFAYWSAAQAASGLGKYSDSLRYSDRCVALAYDNIFCHLEKAHTLIKVRRQREAEAMIDPIRRMITGDLAAVQRELLASRTDQEKDEKNWRIEELRAQQESLNDLIEFSKE